MTALDQLHSYIASVQHPTQTGVTSDFAQTNQPDPSLGKTGTTTPPPTPVPCSFTTIMTGTIDGSGSIGSGTAANSQASLTACVSGAASSASGLPTLLFAGFTWGRVAAFLMGLICLLAGLYLFKPTQSLIVSASSHAKDAIAA